MSRKKVKYAELEEEARDGGWNARCIPIEVGGRDFATIKEKPTVELPKLQRKLLNGCES